MTICNHPKSQQSSYVSIRDLLEFRCDSKIGLSDHLLAHPFGGGFRDIERLAHFDDQLTGGAGPAGPPRPDIIPALERERNDRNMSMQGYPRCSGLERLEAPIPGDLPLGGDDQNLPLPEKVVGF